MYFRGSVELDRILRGCQCYRNRNLELLRTGWYVFVSLALPDPTLTSSHPGRDRRYRLGRSHFIHIRCVVEYRLFRVYFCLEGIQNQVRTNHCTLVHTQSNTLDQNLRQREAVNYHDWFGPSALCGVLFLAVIVNFSLRWKAGF